MADQDTPEEPASGHAAKPSPTPPQLNKQLPPIPRRPVNSAAPSSSDRIDFAAMGGPSAKPTPPSEEAPDYINKGLPHDDIFPPPENGYARPSRPNVVPAASYTGNTDGDGFMSGGNGSVETPSSPLGRRSVQFARNDVVVESPPPLHARHGSWDAADTLSKIRGSSFMTRLKNLAAQGGSQVSRSHMPGGAAEPGGSVTAASTPTVSRVRDPNALNEEGSDVDADAEETADETVTEDAARAKKKKRRIRRTKQAQKVTPSSSRFVSPEADSPIVGPSRLNFRRRATMPDGVDHRVGMSEGEGRDQLVRAGGWRRGSGYTTNHASEAPDELGSPPSGRRLGHMRRISVFGTGAGGVSDGDGTAMKRPFFTGDRASTFGAQKWKQVKNTLKLLTQRKEDRFDYFKSAELMAELRAGAPAVLMLASMIQRDEHGNRRIPVLLEQVKVHIRESMPVSQDDRERHWLFTIDLEYGSGSSRMKWTIKRTIREILNLHWKYKIVRANAKDSHIGPRPKQPRFPISAFPYLRGVRGLDENDEEDGTNARADDTAGEGTAGEGTAAEGTVGENTGAEGTATDVETGRIRPQKRKSRLDVFGGIRTTSGLTGGASSGADFNSTAAEAAATRRKYSVRQQQMLEKYLQEMIRWLMFRADSNRLCRFLELSALGVRLAAEGGYHGKECYLHIQSAKGIDFRRVLTPAKVLARHSRKWFLVRQSYIVCVESPENMNIYDVYLVDSKFEIIPKKGNPKQIAPLPSEDEEIDIAADPRSAKHHTLTLLTSERKVKLFSRNQHLIQQFESSIGEMLRRTPWYLQNRFDSFAPVRHGVHAQWLVDGRDYMWNVSRAINMARDVIYIHDWWLSPELYMRRPACISQKWRLDRLLQRKAKEGVKVFVLIYRNVEAAIPIDSEYTKFSLLNLHPNIFVQRSPNQFKKNQFFFAHHEKICIVDHDVAFLGGIDLCFGRWDCPQHPVADDKPTGFEPQDSPKDAQHCQLFPGKDYSNPRVQDFYRLSEPYEEMYDRSRVPRMPWHDISMQVVGQPARDLTRHFIQRWNYIRRGRKPTRPTPFLLPPPDYKKADLEALGLTGTCEVQILRSATTWSLGIEHTEASIQSAYVKMIEDSDHFVYIENQFFITSTETLNTKIQNRIGDALVDRIARAYENDEDWRCVVIIPLMPGFQNEVNEQDGTSVRLILQCQFRSICRGDHSIFGRLRSLGIEPEDYIQFFSLRQWGKLNNNVLQTEQLYIHAKCIIVDDRVALIGSANINERSMLGSRDSETAAIVRDTDMLWSTMGGKPYRVGRFAHTLRLRLMREHLGLDVDEILEEERAVDLDREAEFSAEMDQIYSGDESDMSPTRGKMSRPRSKNDGAQLRASQSPDLNRDVDLWPGSEGEGSGRKFGKHKPGSSDASADSTAMKAEAEVESGSHKREVAGYGPDHWKTAEKEGLDQGRDSVIVNGREFLVHDMAAEGKGTIDHPKIIREVRPPSDSTLPPDGVGNDAMPPVPPFGRRTTDQLGLPRTNQLPTLPVMDDTDIGGPPVMVDSTGKPDSSYRHPMAADIRLANIHKDCMRDPLNPTFYDDVWSRVAENNTKIFRRVYRVMPDSEVTNWHEYQEYKTYNARFLESMQARPTSKDQASKTDGELSKNPAGAAGVGTPGPGMMAKAVTGKLGAGSLLGRSSSAKVPGTEPTQAALDEKKVFVDSAPGDGDRAPPLDAEKAAAAAAAVDAAGTTILPSAETPPTVGKQEGKPDSPKERRTTFNNNNQEKPGSAGQAEAGATTSSAADCNGNGKAAVNGSVKRRRRGTTRGSRRGMFSGLDEIPTRDEAEEVLNLTQGALVQFPYDWLIVEETNGNWMFQVDQVAPLQIYN